MHKIHSKPFTREDFSHDHMSEEALAALDSMIEVLERLRLRFVETKDKQAWYSMIQLLPESYEQLRTCSFNYETLVHIYFARRDHKLEEWHRFCDWILELPYARELILGEEA